MTAQCENLCKCLDWYLLAMSNTTMSDSSRLVAVRISILQLLSAHIGMQ